MARRDLGEGTRLAAATGAWICFEDEAGQALKPGKARTWARRGRTPAVRVSGNSGRLSVAGMACLKAGEPGRFFYRVRVHHRRKGSRPSLGEDDYAALIAAAHRTLKAPVILIWDNLNTHRSKKMRAFTGRHAGWLTVVHLPGYAPDLNAVEGAWSVMKSSLGNHAATTLDELEAMEAVEQLSRDSCQPVSVKSRIRCLCTYHIVHVIYHILRGIMFSWGVSSGPGAARAR